MASGRKLVVRFGAVSSARFDLEADIGRTRSIGERFLRDVFDRDACRALLQLRRRTETRREGMFLAVELLAQAFEATACSDLRTAETEVDVKAFFDGLIDFVLIILKAVTRVSLPYTFLFLTIRSAIVSMPIVLRKMTLAL